jgi:hypothetical protein
MAHHHRRSGSLSIAQAFLSVATKKHGDPKSWEANMLQTTTGHHQTDRSIAQTLWNWRGEALWIFVGIVLLVVFVDPLILLALATVAVAAPWWAYRKVQHRAERVVRSDAELATVTHLRPTLAGQREKTSAHAPWLGPSAA